MAMGHSSPFTTLQLYASLWPGDEDRIRAALAASWESTSSAEANVLSTS